MMANISDVEIDNVIKTAEKCILNEFLCHSHSLEQYVRPLMKDAGAACDELRRDDYIRTKHFSRKRTPEFALKI